MIVNANSVVPHVIQIKKGNKKTCKCQCKNYRKCKEDHSWNPGICICENSKYLKSIADASVIECDEIISVWILYHQKKTNTMTTNVTENCHCEKGRYKFDCYILDTVLLVIILQLLFDVIIMQNKKVLMH